MTVTPPRVTYDLFARLLEQLGAPAMIELPLAQPSAVVDHRAT